MAKKSQKVRRRHPICQICGIRPSTQAHHVHYEGVSPDRFFAAN